MIFFSKNLAEKELRLKKMIQLEEEYNRLKENYLYVQELIKAGSWTYYIDTDEVFWSEGIYKLLGLKSKSLLNKFEDFYSFIYL